MQTSAKRQTTQTLVHLQQQAAQVKSCLAMAFDQLNTINLAGWRQSLQVLLENLQQQWDRLEALLRSEQAELITAKVQQGIQAALNQLIAKQLAVTNADIGAPVREASLSLLLPLLHAYRAWLVVEPIGQQLDQEAERLRVEQASLELNEHTRERFYQLLATIKSSVGLEYARVQCAICYALDTEHTQAPWLAAFVSTFARHLAQAGIVIKPMPELAGLTTWLKEVDFALVLGSESLVAQQRQGEPAVCAQLNAIDSRRQETQGRARPFVLPILLSGSKEQALPAALWHATTIEEFKAYSYLGYLKRLLRYLLQIGEQHEAFNQCWQAFETNHPLLSQGLSPLMMEAYLANVYQAPSNRKAFLQATQVVNQWLEQTRHSVPVLCNAILPPSDYYTGRTHALTALSDYFATPSANAQVKAITGLGGVGKTQLARQYVQQYRHRYALMWWLDVDSLDIGYLALASSLGLSTQNLKAQEVCDLVKQRLRQLPDWLLVFDNAQNYEQLQAYLPQQHSHTRGHVLITSRNLSWPNALHLHEFQSEEAIDLLWRIWTQDDAAVRLRHLGWDKTFYTQASPLAQDLGYLPLALVQAGVYIKHTGQTLQGYRTLFEQQRQALWEKSGHKPEGYNYTVATTWTLSMQKARQETPLAQSLIQYCAFVHHAAIPRYLIAQLLPDSLAEHDAVRALQHYALLEANPMLATLSIHQLVQLVVQDALDKAEQQTCLASLFEAMNAIWPEFEVKSLLHIRQRRELTLHLAEIITHGKQVPLKNQNDLADGMAELGAIYLEIGDAKKSLEYSQQALVIQQHIAQPLPAELMTLLNLINLALEDKNFRPSSEEITQMQQQYNKPASPHLAMLLNNISMSYQALGDFKQALDFQLQSLSMYRQLYQEPHQRIADTLSNLGTICGNLNWYEKQISCHQKALAIYQQLYKAPHINIATALNNLGESYRASGRSIEAMECLKESLEMCEELFGENPQPYTAAVLNNLALLYDELSEYQQGLVCYLKALKINQQLYQAPQPDIALALNNVGGSYLCIGELEQAEKYLNQARDMIKQLYSPPHPYIATIINNFANLYKARGDLQ